MLTVTSLYEVSSYAGIVPWGLERHYGAKDLHFITSSCYRRRPLLGTAMRRVIGRRRRNSLQGELFERVPERVWQHRFYDFNVCTEKKRIEKLRYLHRNPVKRGLVVSPELWKWSSFRSYALKEPGVVQINRWDVLQLKRTEAVRFDDPIGSVHP